MTIHSESFIEHLSLYFFRKNYVIYRDIILTRIRNIGLEKKTPLQVGKKYLHYK